MTSYYTRAKARGEIEPEDVEQGDSALEATTTTDMVISVGLQGASMRESESMSTEVAGSVTTHPLATTRGRPFLRGWRERDREVYLPCQNTTNTYTS